MAASATLAVGVTLMSDVLITSLMVGMDPPPAREPSGRVAAREALLAWFDAEAPSYPWRRRERDPYAVLVSEVMLQQTQAARVVDAFPRFLGLFPNVGALARATRASALRAWAGLGYNRRAVALHRAARSIVGDHGGRVPADVSTLLELPGVGPYTAAAVASIAFGVPVPAIDTNARKVVSRLALGVEPGETSTTEIVREAGRWLARDRPGDWNQAVMNLGRQVCRPVPRCDVCPLSPACRFRMAGRSGQRSAPAMRQPAFEGSMRQVRGRVVDELRGRTHAIPTEALADAIGESPVRIEVAIDALQRDGVVERTAAGRVRLPR